MWWKRYLLSENLSRLYEALPEVSESGLDRTSASQTDVRNHLEIVPERGDVH